MLRLIIGLLALLVTSLTFGSEPGGHHETAIPWDLLQKQAFNFLLVVGVATYFLRQKIRDYFKSRVEDFEKQAALAKKAKTDAENQKHEMKNRLEKLQSTAIESIEQARREAQEMAMKIETEAQALAKKLKEDAALTVQRELERAKSELKDEVLAQAMSQAREQMKTSVKEPDQTRLQNEFVEKIQVAR